MSQLKFVYLVRYKEIGGTDISQKIPLILTQAQENHIGEVLQTLELTEDYEVLYSGYDDEQTVTFNRFVCLSALTQKEKTFVGIAGVHLMIETANVGVQYI